jgi:hypothetical protein
VALARDTLDCRWTARHSSWLRFVDASHVSPAAYRAEAQVGRTLTSASTRSDHRNLGISQGFGRGDQAGANRMTEERRHDTEQRRGGSAGKSTAKIVGAIVVALLVVAILLLASGVVKMSPLTGP